jgi:hypothetical protein
MSRIPKERGLDNVIKIMFACTPQKTNQFAFLVLYLGKDDEIMLTLDGDNHFDWKYFKGKFEEAVVDEGFVYDLEGYGNLKSVRESFVDQSSVNFGVLIDGKELEYGQTLLLKDVESINLKEQAKELLLKIGAKTALIRLYTDAMTGTNAEFCFINGQGVPVSRYEMKHGNFDAKLYASELLEKMQSNEQIKPQNVHLAFNQELQASLQPEWFRFITLEKLAELASKGLLCALSKDECDKFLDGAAGLYRHLLKTPVQ